MGAITKEERVVGGTPVDQSGPSVSYSPDSMFLMPAIAAFYIETVQSTAV